jgi:hypothetical protein
MLTPGGPIASSDIEANWNALAEFQGGFRQQDLQVADQMGLLVDGVLNRVEVRDTYRAALDRDHGDSLSAGQIDGCTVVILPLSGDLNTFVVCRNHVRFGPLAVQSRPKHGRPYSPLGMPLSGGRRDDVVSCRASGIADRFGRSAA